MTRWVAVVLITMTGQNVVSAAELRSIDVQYNDDQYTVVSIVWFDARLGAMFEVFSSWELSEDFSAAVVEARDLEPDEHGRAGFYVVNRGCVWFFCKTLTRQGYVESEENKVIRAFADPAYSDFKVSDEAWEFADDGDGTVVTYTLLMQPDFWVPPAIGPYLIKRKLRNDGQAALNQIEVIAQSLGSTGGVVLD